MRGHVTRRKRFLALLALAGIALAGCRGFGSPTPVVPGVGATFPATWTPTTVVEDTPTATLVVQPTPTWDGTPPPPSEAYVPRLLPGQLYRSLTKGEGIAVVDVRSLAAFEQARVPGAIHIPLEELEERAGELDGNKAIAIYCLSPNDAMSLQGAMILYRLGFAQVSVLKGGIQRWYSEGYAVEGTILTPTPRFSAPPGTVTPLPTPTHRPTVVGTPTSVPLAPTTVPLAQTATPTATKSG